MRLYTSWGSTPRNSIHSGVICIPLIFLHVSRQIGAVSQLFLMYSECETMGSSGQEGQESRSHSWRIVAWPRSSWRRQQSPLFSRPFEVQTRAITALIGLSITEFKKGVKEVGNEVKSADEAPKKEKPKT